MGFATVSDQLRLMTKKHNPMRISMRQTPIYRMPSFHSTHYSFLRNCFEYFLILRFKFVEFKMHVPEYTIQLCFLLKRSTPLSFINVHISQRLQAISLPFIRGILGRIYIYIKMHVPEYTIQLCFLLKRSTPLSFINVDISQRLQAISLPFIRGILGRIYIYIYIKMHVPEYTIQLCFLFILA